MHIYLPPLISLESMGNSVSENAHRQEKRRRIEKINEWQHDEPDQGGENHQHSRIAIFEITLDEIFIYMSRGSPEHRTRERKNYPHFFMITILKIIYKLY